MRLYKVVKNNDIILNKSPKKKERNKYNMMVCNCQ